MNVRQLALTAAMLSVGACASTPSAPAALSREVATTTTTAVVSETSTTAALATTVAVATTTVPVVTTVIPTIAASPRPTITVDPHGVAIESGCVRSNIDFAAVRAQPGKNQTQVGEIPPGTCGVLVYATGSDGRIPWLEVAIGDVFGWSAQSNFVQSSFGPPPIAASPVTSPPIGSAALDLQAETVFGFHVGSVSSDEMIGVVSGRLGAPTSDTGWVPPAPSTGDDTCDIVVPSRTVRWGDLSLNFWQNPDSDFLWLWTVGDLAVTGQVAPPGGTTALGPPTGLRDAAGIGVGSTIESVNAADGAEFQFAVPGAGQQNIRGTVDPTEDSAALMLAVDDLVTGLGSMLQFC